MKELKPAAAEASALAEWEHAATASGAATEVHG